MSEQAIVTLQIKNETAELFTCMAVALDIPKENMQHFAQVLIHQGLNEIALKSFHSGSDLLGRIQKLLPREGALYKGYLEFKKGVID